MRALALIEAEWMEPVAAAAAVAEEPHALLLLSKGAEQARWSYLMWAPTQTLEAGSDDPVAELQAMLSPDFPIDPAGPPFQGGVAGLAAYEFGARLEPAMPQGRLQPWPDLAAGLYLAVLAFDHAERRLVAVGRGETDEAARGRAGDVLRAVRGAGPAPYAGPMALSFAAVTPPQAYEAAVADVVQAIGRGEIFQANIAQCWTGRLNGGARPLDLLARLEATSPAAFGAYFRLPGLALVSNSPERFLQVAPEAGRLWARAEPIKGTRPRGSGAAADGALAAELTASEKDRAENLMIVDLMRNDLSRTCEAGTIAAPELFRLRSLANVHHLVSTVTGRVAQGRTALDVFGAAFPPGSVTGAPKIQAMQVIARHEPPRGPYCGSLFWAGHDGAFDSSVLIRTVAFEQDAEGWRFEARAGAGIVADSDPVREREETEAKISALRAALVSR